MAETIIRRKADPAVLKRRKAERVRLFLMAVPFIVFIFIFAYIPLAGWALAFFRYKVGMDFLKMQFVGLYNFSQLLFFGKDISNALINTLAMSFLGIAMSPLPVIFAIMLSEAGNRRFSKIAQSVTTLPNFLSYVIVFMLVFGIFSRDGAFNTIMLNLGLIKEAPATTILANKDATWFFQTVIGIWKGLGWGAIVYLAAITAIDQELYDAADVDGAGRFRKIWHITVPGVIETYLVLLLLGVSGILSSDLGRIIVFYNPLVANKIETLDYFLYRVGIKLNDISFTTAVSILQTFVCVILLFTVNGISKKLRGYPLL